MFTGSTASKGFAVGKVVYVRQSGNAERKFEEGDILVTEMTSPDLVPLMQKAAAIVTSIGGRTCHVAIVSREYNLPGIVGCGEEVLGIATDTTVTVDARERDGTITVGEA